MSKESICGESSPAEGPTVKLSWRSARIIIAENQSVSDYCAKYGYELIAIINRATRNDLIDIVVAITTKEATYQLCDSGIYPHEGFVAYLNISPQDSQNEEWIVTIIRGDGEDPEDGSWRVAAGVNLHELWDRIANDASVASRATNLHIRDDIWRKLLDEAEKVAISPSK